MDVSDSFLRAGCEEGSVEQDGPGRGIGAIRRKNEKRQKMLTVLLKRRAGPFPTENAFIGKSSVREMCCPGTALLVGNNEKLPTAATPHVWSQKEHLL